MVSIVHFVPRFSPKQSEIVDDLRRRIIAGELAPGAQLPGLVEMSRKYKTSEVTAQRAMAHLRKAGFVRTRRREGSYVSLNLPNLCNFGIVFDHPAGVDHYEFNYLTVWLREAKRLMDPGLPRDERRRISLFHEVPGAEPGRKHRELIEKVENQQLAGVVFPEAMIALRGTPVMEAPDLARVVVSPVPVPGCKVVALAPFTEDVLDFLATRGRKRVAFITITFHPSKPYTQQLIGQAACRGLTTHPHWVQAACVTSPGWALNCVRLLLHGEGDDRPDALVITDDNLVPDATKGILEAGVRVPDELEVIAHCNFPWPTANAVPVWRVGYDIRKLLHTCLGLIERQRRGGHVPDVTEMAHVFDAELKNPFEGVPE